MRSDRKKRNKKRKRLIAALVVLVVLLGAYAGGVVYASQRFLPNTSIRGMNISGMSSDAANELLESEELLIDVEQKVYNSGDHITETINLAEVANAKIKYDTDELLQSQDKYLWFKSFFEPTELEKAKAEGSFDMNQLKLAIRKLYSQNGNTAVQPRDAYLKIEGTTVNIVPDEEGSVVDREIAVERIIAAAEAVVGGEGKQLVDLSDACKEPKRRANDPEIIAQRELLEKTAGRKITIWATSYTSYEIEGADIMDFFTLKGGELAIDEDKLNEYVDWMTDYYYINRYEHLIYDDLKEKLQTALLSDKDEEVEASWYYNYPTPQTNGNGSPSFVEISIGSQYLWYYENGHLIFSTPIVTGKRGEFDTPTGYFTITNMEQDARLKALDYDHEVKYWMGIDYSGWYGLHDASWRWDYGGDIYVNNGSHGCVNLPLWAAAELYDHVKVGVTEVYIYN